LFAGVGAERLEALQALYIDFRPEEAELHGNLRWSQY